MLTVTRILLSGTPVGWAPQALRASRNTSKYKITFFILSRPRVWTGIQGTAHRAGAGDPSPGNAFGFPRGQSTPKGPPTPKIPQRVGIPGTRCDGGGPEPRPYIPSRPCC